MATLSKDKKDTNPPLDIPGASIGVVAETANAPSTVRQSTAELRIQIEESCDRMGKHLSYPNECTRRFREPGLESEANNLSVSLALLLPTGVRRD
jgi:hypothetical protein